MFYSFKATDISGNEIDFQKYKGKVVLIVNTATGCGFTPQYEGLENLYDEFKDKNFEILDFPCNQFGHQAPGNNEEILDFCKVNYGVSFQQFSKIDVNGKNEHSLYTWLKKQKSGFMGSKIKWNFTKFLIDRNGNVVERFAPTVKPEDLANKIIQLL